MGKRLTPKEVTQRFQQEAEAAAAWFGLDPTWHIIYQSNPKTSGAEVSVEYRYLRAVISYNVSYFRDNPDDIRRFAAHEIAHLLGAELIEAQSRMKKKWRSDKSPEGRMLNDAFEAQTVRLERLYLRQAGKGKK